MTVGTTEAAVPGPVTARQAGTVGAGGFIGACLARGRIELLQLSRNREAVIFTLALPVVLLILLASIFSGKIKGTDVNYSQLYATSLIAGGLASTCFLNLAIAVASERENGALKRLAGTPMPRVAYFAGKAIMVIVACSVEVAVLMLFGHFAYGVAFPGSVGKWFIFVWVTALGATCMALLGICISSLARNASSATPLANLPLLVLEFLSGIFVPFTSLSHGLYSFAGLFPLRWIAEGYGSALLPNSFERAEPGHNWGHGETVLVLALWTVAGLVVAARTFRWSGRGES